METSCSVCSLVKYKISIIDYGQCIDANKCRLWILGYAKLN